MLTRPEYKGIRTTATVEADFMGNQPSDVSETAFLTNGALRMRLANVRTRDGLRRRSPGPGLVPARTFNLFFLPASTLILSDARAGLQARRAARVSHTFKTAPVNFELGISANRPPQRDAQVPDVQAGLRLSLNDWKGIHSPGGRSETSLDALMPFGFGRGRRFRVSDFEGTPLGAAPDPRFSNRQPATALSPTR